MPSLAGSTVVNAWRDYFIRQTVVARDYRARGEDGQAPILASEIGRGIVFILNNMLQSYEIPIIESSQVSMYRHGQGMLCFRVHLDDDRAICMSLDYSTSIIRMGFFTEGYAVNYRPNSWPISSFHSQSMGAIRNALVAALRLTPLHPETPTIVITPITDPVYKMDLGG